LFKAKNFAMKLKATICIITILLFSFCRKAPKNPDSCDFSGDSNDYFTIIGNADSPNRAFNVFCKKVNVFGVMVYATSKVSDAELLHCANILAQYLDNDEDGYIDNQLVLDKMLENNSCMVLFAKEKSSKKRRFYNSEGDFYEQSVGQDLYGEETHPGWNKTNPFDATLEEVLHLISSTGYSKAYPDIFGEQKGSAIANAMDLARGGQFTSIPNQYPAGAWYTYNDKTCEYDCQVTEYFYWALTSLLGAQDYNGRLDEIANEWIANTSALIQFMDPDIYSLLMDTLYHLPVILPDGKYRR